MNKLGPLFLFVEQTLYSSFFFFFFFFFLLLFSGVCLIPARLIPSLLLYPLSVRPFPFRVAVPLFGLSLLNTTTTEFHLLFAPPFFISSTIYDIPI
jgi:hypothetical protein